MTLTRIVALIGGTGAFYLGTINLIEAFRHFFRRRNR